MKPLVGDVFRPRYNRHHLHQYLHCHQHHHRHRRHHFHPQWYSSNSCSSSSNVRRHFICLISYFFCWTMHRSFLRHFPNVPPLCRDWFDFDNFDYAFYPPEPDPQEHVALFSEDRLMTSCFYREAPPLSNWYNFMNDAKNRYAVDWTPWYRYYIPQPGFFLY